MKDIIDLDKVQADAERRFRDGDFFCSESIMASIRDNVAPEMPEQMIAMASGFPVGVGRSKCMCGAVSGGVLCMGYFFGRTQGKDPVSEKTLALSKEVHEDFLKNHRVACCSILTSKFDMSKGEHKKQCVAFTGEVARNTARIIAREKGIPTVGDEKVVANEKAFS